MDDLAEIIHLVKISGLSKLEKKYLSEFGTHCFNLINQLDASDNFIGYDVISSKFANCPGLERKNNLKEKAIFKLANAVQDPWNPPEIDNLELVKCLECLEYLYHIAPVRKDIEDTIYRSIAELRSAIE